MTRASTVKRMEGITTRQLVVITTMPIPLLQGVS
jgi:hypothetical protein